MNSMSDAEVEQVLSTLAKNLEGSTAEAGEKIDAADGALDVEPPSFWRLQLRVATALRDAVEARQGGGDQ